MASLLKSSLKGSALSIARRFDQHMAKKLSSTRLRVAARAVASAEIDMIRTRTSKGLDKSGSPMKAYSNAYSTRKAKIISSGYKVGKGRGKNRRLVSIRPTAFAANRVGDFMRLSGRMFTDMYIKNLKAQITPKGIVATYDIDFKTARSKRLAEYHNVLGTGKSKIKRKWLGPAKTENENRKLVNIFVRAMKGV